MTKQREQLTTTLNRILEHSPCPSGWEKLLKHLGKTQADDEPLPYSTIVESNGLDDALWCCRTEPRYDKEWKLFAVWCARQVQHQMTDQRSITALDVAERYANGEATDDELKASIAAARIARDDVSGSAHYAASAAAASAAGATASTAAAYYVSSIASTASDAAATASDAAIYYAASDATVYYAATAARSAANTDDRSSQTKRFLEVVGGGK
jgi:hypothetical protein